MAIKLPPKKDDGDEPEEQGKLPPPPMKNPQAKRQENRAARDDALSPGDTIEYGITMEVSPEPGRKAWIKFGTTSSVRADETTTEAEARIHRFVSDGFDQRLEDLS